MHKIKKCYSKNCTSNILFHKLFSKQPKWVEKYMEGYKETNLFNSLIISLRIVEYSSIQYSE